MIIEDNGIIINKSKWSETSAIVTIFNPNYGLLKGLAKGALKKNVKINLEIGNLVKFKKYSSKEGQLGILNVELLECYLSKVITSNLKLLMLHNICNIIEVYTGEGNPAFSQLYVSTLKVLDSLNFDVDTLKKLYIHWELEVLRAIGVGLDLSKCAVTLKVSELEYISPKTGRAVCKEVGDAFKDKLLKLPKLLLNIKTDSLNKECEECFKVTTYFFNKYNLEYNKTLPLLRSRMIELFNI